MIEPHAKLPPADTSAMQLLTQVLLLLLLRLFLPMLLRIRSKAKWSHICAACCRLQSEFVDRNHNV